jgi:hypothetical protein
MRSGDGGKRRSAPRLNRSASLYRVGLRSGYGLDLHTRFAVLLRVGVFDIIHSSGRSTVRK